MLTFVIPVRHPSSIAEPEKIRRLMGETLASISAQTHSDWQCVIAAEKEALLPDLPNKVSVVETNIPAPDLPDFRVDRRANRAAVRVDKGTRIMTALVAEQPSGHVMIVDYDDLVSCRPAKVAASAPESIGWYIDSGWLYSGGNLMSFYPERFNRLCGTSIIVQSRLLRIPRTMAEFDADYAARTLGSHIYIREDLEAAGTPLARLPFPGAVYRIGHADSVSLSTGILSRVFNRQTVRRPADMLKELSRIRLRSGKTRQEFFRGTS